MQTLLTAIAAVLQTAELERQAADTSRVVPRGELGCWKGHLFPLVDPQGVPWAHLPPYALAPALPRPGALAGLSSLSCRTFSDRSPGGSFELQQWTGCPNSHSETFLVPAVETRRGAISRLFRGQC